jgi:serine/threonine protein phosphatase 1
MEALPIFLDLDEALLVHGFFEPGVPLGSQRETVILGTLTGEGHLEKRLAAPWYELYDGPKPIIVGHRDYLGTGQPLVHRDRVFGIDTGCCRGGRLTGLLLPSFELLSVPARQNYWSEAQEENADVRLEATRDDERSWDDLATLIPALEARAEESSHAQDRLARVRGLLAEGEVALERLLAQVTQENERILGELRGVCAYDALPPEEQGRRYAALITARTLAPLLHAARKGKMNRDELRRRYPTPRALAGFTGPAA